GRREPEVCPGLPDRRALLPPLPGRLAEQVGGGIPVGFWGYVGKRIALLAPVLFGMTIIVFGMLRLIPGDPAYLYLGERATPEAAAVVREQLGLNRPLTEQYWRFLSGIFTGSLGNSLYYKKPVLGLILERMPATVFLTFYAAGLAALITVPIASI